MPTTNNAIVTENELRLILDRIREIEPTWRRGDGRLVDLCMNVEPQTCAYSRIGRRERRGIDTIRWAIEDVYESVLPEISAARGDALIELIRLLRMDGYTDLDGEIKPDWRCSWHLCPVRPLVERLAPALESELGTLIDAMTPKTTPNANGTPTAGVEQRSAGGFITKPLDEAAYTPMNKILADCPAEWSMTTRKLGALLNENRDSIRQWKPSKNRRMIHRGDWGVFTTRFVKDDGWPTPAEIEQRKAALKAEKDRRK